MSIVEWEERPECWLCRSPQGTPISDQLHIGAISASKILIYLGLSKFSEPPDESARQCVGLSLKRFDSTLLDPSLPGIYGEPLIRSWYEGWLGKPIKQMGVAVWKKDPRFRASLDGEFEGNGGLEIKITGRIYQPLVQYIQAWNRGFRPPTNFYHAHIWDAHYAQLTQEMAVSGKKSIDFIVASTDYNQIFIENIAFNPEYWESFLYPKGVEFLTRYVEPLMDQHQIKRIDP